MLHRLLFDTANPAESANLGAYLRLDSPGKLVSYSNRTEAGNVTFTFVDADVTVGSDSIAETNHGLETGDIVRLTTTGTLPAGLATATDYYVIRVDANNFKLASSLVNAEAGTAVDITAAAGGGTHTVTEQARTHAAMDVNLVNASIIVTATDLDIRDLTHVSDSVKVGDGTDFLAINVDGSINITDNSGSLTVDAVNFDIRDLVFATDKVDVSGSAVSITSSSGQFAEDAPHTSGNIGNFMLAVANHTEGALHSADGDYAALQVDSAGRLRVVADLDTVNLAEKAEDAAHVSGDVGDYVLAVRADARPTNANTSANGDYASFFVNNSGELWVKDADMLAELQSITHAEDVAHVSGDMGIMPLAVRNDTLGALAGTNGDYAPFQVNASGALYVEASGVVTVNDAALANTAISAEADTVTTVSGALVTSVLASRKYIDIYNNGNKIIWIGQSGVSISTGFPIFPGSLLSARIGAAVAIHAVTDAGSQNVRVLQAS